MNLKNFITFEGGECSGKTTIIKDIVKKFEELNIDYITTREPGGLPICEQIRDVILDVKNTDMSSECEALLYAASRIQHVKQKIVPAVNEGKVVLCDRFLDSSLAYQGYARGIGFDKILKANEFSLNYLPGLTIFIDVRPEVALKRLQNSDRSSKSDRLDKESIEFHQKVYDGYKKIAMMYPDRIVTIDGNQDLKTVCQNCIDVVLNYLKK